MQNQTYQLIYVCELVKCAHDSAQEAETWKSLRRDCEF